MANLHYDEILKKIHGLQDQLEEELEELVSKKREEFQYKLKKGKVTFDKNIRDIHQKYRVGIWTYLKNTHPLYILTSPIIYGVIFPLIFLDIAVFLYQQICFRVYEIPIVRRADFIVIDRQNLDYLNGIEKFNCMYCGYGNGLIEYIREVFSRTEQYWCPIKHARRAVKTHYRTEKFVDYGDVETYKKQLGILRKELNSMAKTK